MSRDPIDEDGGENLYAFAGNIPLEALDLLGSKAIRFAFGFDKSFKKNGWVHGPGDGPGFWSKFVTRVREIVQICREKSRKGEYSASLASLNTIEVAPPVFAGVFDEDPKGIKWGGWGRKYDMELLRVISRQIRERHGGIPVLITAYGIADAYGWSIYENRKDVHDQSRAILIDWSAPRGVLGHEMGHGMYWFDPLRRVDGGIHSPDPDNLMYSGADCFDRREPDDQYCCLLVRYFGGPTK